MDPYIEACGLWEDFHHGLIAQIAGALSRQLPENYLARTGVRAYIVLVESEEKKEHPFQADVGITAPATGTPAPREGGAVATEPSTETGSVSLRPFIVEEFKEGFVEIYELRPERRLVTCIEVLSPSNKRKDSEGWNQYLRKRQALLLGEANLVEIDLLRGGTKMPTLDPWPNSPYTLLVARRIWPGHCKVWSAHFQRPLPPIPVPLSSPNADILLELQPLVDALYAERRYDIDVDYSQSLRPALSAEESAWVQAQLQARATPTTRPDPAGG
jgi:hypothetical protein